MIETCPAGFSYADAEEEPIVELPTTTTSSTTTTSTSTTTTKPVHNLIILEIQKIVETLKIIQ